MFDQNNGQVIAVSLSSNHSFSKLNVKEIQLVKGEGVKGDAHCGKNVKHRSRVRQNPDQPNLRQVHLIHQELFEELAESGYHINPGEIGENVTTSGVDLLSLSKDTLMYIGDKAVVRITGLRNPCVQLNDFQDGLMGQLVYKNAHGDTIRKSGVMAVVEKGGVIRPGDKIRVKQPGSYTKLERV